MNAKTNIMLSTSVYGFERDIVQICALLKDMGYNVWNSHLWTINGLQTTTVPQTMTMGQAKVPKGRPHPTPICNVGF